MLVCDYCRCEMNKYNHGAVKIITPHTDNHWQADDETEFEICLDCAEKLTKMLSLGESKYHYMLEEGYHFD